MAVVDVVGVQVEAVEAVAVVAALVVMGVAPVVMGASADLHHVDDAMPAKQATGIDVGCLAWRGSQCPITAIRCLTYCTPHVLTTFSPGHHALPQAITPYHKQDPP